MSKIVKTSILVMPESSPTATIQADYLDMQQLARLSGRLSYMVDNKVGLTPGQLADLVKALDKFVGLEDA